MKRVLVVGAGHDPYRHLFPKVELYTTLDVVRGGAINVVGDAAALPFRAETYDCVVALEVMEHVRTPEKLIEEAYRVLSVGGTLIVSVPFMYHQHADPYDFWRPTSTALEQLLDRFSKTRVTAQGNRVQVLSDLVTTSFSPMPVFFLLRIFNHFLGRLRWGGRSSAPSGFFAVAVK